MGVPASCVAVVGGCARPCPGTVSASSSNGAQSETEDGCLAFTGSSSNGAQSETEDRSRLFGLALRLDRMESETT